MQRKCMLMVSREGSCEKLQTFIRTFVNISTTWTFYQPPSSKECSKLSCPTAVPAQGSLECRGSSCSLLFGRPIGVQKVSLFPCMLHNSTGVTVNFIGSWGPSISESHIPFYVLIWSFVTAACLFLLSGHYLHMSMLHERWCSIRMSTFLRKAIKDKKGFKHCLSSALHQWAMQNQTFLVQI